jgi:hypothetical protein
VGSRQGRGGGRGRCCLSRELPGFRRVQLHCKRVVSWGGGGCWDSYSFQQGQLHIAASLGELHQLHVGMSDGVVVMRQTSCHSVYIILLKGPLQRNCVTPCNTFLCSRHGCVSRELLMLSRC